MQHACIVLHVSNAFVHHSITKCRRLIYAHSNSTLTCIMLPQKRVKLSDSNLFKEASTFSFSMPTNHGYYMYIHVYNMYSLYYNATQSKAHQFETLQHIFIIRTLLREIAFQTHVDWASFQGSRCMQPYTHIYIYI